MLGRDSNDSPFFYTPAESAHLMTVVDVSIVKVVPVGLCFVCVLLYKV